MRGVRFCLRRLFFSFQLLQEHKSGPIKDIVILEVLAEEQPAEQASQTSIVNFFIRADKLKVLLELHGDTIEETVLLCLLLLVVDQLPFPLGFTL